MTRRLLLFALCLLATGLPRAADAALVLVDRTAETSTTTGTGPLTLAGATSNHVSFNAAVGVGNTTYYAIVSRSPVTEWEVGLGTLTGATTLARTTPYLTWNGTTLCSTACSALSLSAGTKDVFVTIPAAAIGAPVPFANLTGSAVCAQLPALTGHVTTSAGGCATTIGAGVVSNAMLANSAVTVTGTANRVTVSGSPVALGGTLTLSGPQDLATTSTPQFSALGIGGAAALSGNLHLGTDAGQITKTATAINSVLPLFKLSPSAGSTNSAPFEALYSMATTFETEQDPVMYWGYNASRAVVTEPTMRWVIEGNYRHLGGRRDVETYWEYVGADGTGRRPIFWFMDKGTSATSGLVIGESNINVNAAGNNAIYMAFTPIGVNQAYLSSASGMDLWSQGIGIGAGISLNEQGVGNSALRGTLRLSASTLGSPTGETDWNSILLSTGPLQAGRYRITRDGVHQWITSRDDAANTNYERLALTLAAGSATFAAQSGGTGSANIDITLTPKGTGHVIIGGTNTLQASAFTSTQPGLVPASGGGSTNFLNADGGFSVPAGSGTGNVNAGTLTANAMTKATGALTIANSLLTDTGTVLAYSGTGGVSVTAGPLTFTDAQFLRNAANVMELRGVTPANPQGLLIDNTWTDASNYERGFMRWATNILQIGTEGLGTGAATLRDLYLIAGTKTLSLTAAGVTTVPGELRLGANTTTIWNVTGAQPAITFANSANGIAVKVAAVSTSTSGGSTMLKVGDSAVVGFGPGSGSASHATLHVNPVISGTSTGTAYGLGVASKTNTLTGGTIKPLSVGTTTTDLFTGYTPLFEVGIAGNLNLAKMTASASAPGAALAKLEVVCGTNAGTVKLIMYAGTSGTAVTVVDNVGASVTGC